MALSLVLATFLAVHLLAIAFSGSLWGVDSLAYYPAWGARLAALLTLPLLIPALRRRLTVLLLTERGRASPRAAGVALVTIAAATVAVLGWRFPSALPLLGDGRMHLDGLQQAAHIGTGFERGPWANDHAPLSSFALGALNDLVVGRGGAPADTFRWVSLLAGVAWTLLAGLAARTFVSGNWRPLLFVALLSGGYLQLFFGYVEVYPPLFPLGLGVILAARMEQRARRWPLATGTLLGLATAFHFSLASLAPVVVAATFAGPIGRGPALLRAAVGLALAAGTAVALLWLVGFDLAGYVQADRGANFLPLFAEPTFRQAYRALSPAHLLDALNVLLLVAPVAVLALPFVRRTAAPVSRTPRAHGALPLLAAAGVGPLLFLLVANAEIGAFRDWDALAFVAVPLTLFAGVALSRNDKARSREVWLAATLVALGHTALWIGVNADPDRALARFTERLQTSPTSRHARAYGWETLGHHRRAIGDPRGAADAYTRAAESAANPRLWALAGDAWHQTGDVSAAERSFARALEIDPEHARGLSGRAALIAEAGNWTRAIPLLERSVARDPRNVYGWWLLGVGQREIGEPLRALASFRRALEAQPTYAVAWVELGRTELLLDRPGAARDALTRYLELAPNARHADWARGVVRDLAGR